MGQDDRVFGADSETVYVGAVDRICGIGQDPQDQVTAVIGAGRRGIDGQADWR